MAGNDGRTSDRGDRAALVVLIAVWCAVAALAHLTGWYAGAPECGCPPAVLAEAEAGDGCGCAFGGRCDCGSEDGR